MSVFKRYNINNLNNLNKNKKSLYFPVNDEILHYDKEIDQELFQFIDKLSFVTLHKKSNNFLDFYIINNKDLSQILNYCKRCSKEISYNIIRSNFNFISKLRLRYIGLVSFILSCKILFGYDFCYDDIHKKFINLLNKTAKIKLKSKIYLKVEIDIFSNEQFNVCKKVRTRIGDIN